MEVFVKIMTESCTRDDHKQIAAISFLTFVGLDSKGKPTEVPLVSPESKEEEKVFSEREIRKLARLKKRDETNGLIEEIS